MLIAVILFAACTVQADRALLGEHGLRKHAAPDSPDARTDTDPSIPESAPGLYSMCVAGKTCPPVYGAGVLILQQY